MDSTGAGGIFIRESEEEADEESSMTGSGSWDGIEEGEETERERTQVKGEDDDDAATIGGVSDSFPSSSAMKAHLVAVFAVGDNESDRLFLRSIARFDSSLDCDDRNDRDDVALDSLDFDLCHFLRCSSFRLPFLLIISTVQLAVPCMLPSWTEASG